MAPGTEHARGPHLHGIDLGGADVPDVTVLADLPRLAPSRPGPETVGGVAPGRHPPAPTASARLAGPGVTFEDALTLASRLGLDAGSAPRVADTL